MALVSYLLVTRHKKYESQLNSCKGRQRALFRCVYVKGHLISDEQISIFLDSSFFFFNIWQLGSPYLEFRAMVVVKYARRYLKNFPFRQLIYDYLSGRPDTEQSGVRCPENIQRPDMSGVRQVFKHRTCPVSGIRQSFKHRTCPASGVRQKLESRTCPVSGENFVFGRPLEHLHCLQKLFPLFVSPLFFQSFFLIRLQTSCKQAMFFIWQNQFEYCKNRTNFQ